LTFDEMSDACFGQDGDGDCVHYFGDHVGVGHADYAAVFADVGGDALECHDGYGAGFFGDASLEGEEGCVSFERSEIQDEERKWRSVGLDGRR